MTTFGTATTKYPTLVTTFSDIYKLKFFVERKQTLKQLNICSLTLREPLLKGTLPCFALVWVKLRSIPVLIDLGWWPLKRTEMTLA